MLRITTISHLKDVIRELRQRDEPVGLVPTMGALHEGHLSLIKASLQNGDQCIASIFVNPTQFNDKTDLLNYPRDLEKDCALLTQAGCDMVFIPAVEEMYPKPDTRQFELGNLGSVMEGLHRPGHFNGVAQIVTKLFDAVTADRAYFGKKDFQQLAIIRKLVNDLDYNVEIIACPIIREPDGLAMSSRNRLLNTDQRKAAALIYQCLQMAGSRISKDPIAEIETHIGQIINSNPFLKLEYFQIVESESLRQIRKIAGEKVLNACIAVYAGNVRLIDNVDIIL